MSIKGSKVLQKKIKMALSGANGRMGLAVQSLIRKNNSSFTLIEKRPPLTRPPLGPKATQKALQHWDPQKIEGVIDFSSPKLLSLTLKWCVQNQKPLVSGTTGLSPAQKRALKRASQKIPIFYEENMSWGIWQIKQWLNSLSHTSYEILLTDIHHKNKKDKPSGTALKLKKHFPPFAKKKLKVKSVREEDVFGTHKIVFQGQEELITLEHLALSRKLFAGGSLKALKWLVKAPKGLYSFDDLYG